jgi:hypothetical protein
VLALLRKIVKSANITTNYRPEQRGPNSRGFDIVGNAIKKVEPGAELGL